MSRTSRSPYVDQVRYHAPGEIDALLVWCEANVQTKPGHVVAIGLAYAHGLNEHQIAAATLTARDPAVTIAYPLARRAAEIRAAARAPLVIEEPDWLAEAAVALAADVEPADTDLLYRARRRLNIPLHADYVRKLVAEAGRAACSTRISCMTLNQSRTAALRREGLTFALFGGGYADSWAARLGAAELVLRLPRRAA